MADNYFKQLYDIDVRGKTKTKNGLKYLSWAAAWAEFKKVFPDATYKIYDQTITYVEKTESLEITTTVDRPWFDDRKSGWAVVGVTANGIENIEKYAIMDFKNKAIKAEDITSVEANKAIQRALVKACARHGLALYIYEGEDLPEELKEVESLQAELMTLISKKSALSDGTKKKVGELCKEILSDENGDPRLCDDAEKLNTLKKKLMATRKVA